MQNHSNTQNPNDTSQSNNSSSFYSQGSQGFQSHRGTSHPHLPQGLLMSGFSQSMSGSSSGALNQNPGSIAGSSDSYFRPILSPGISGNGSSIHAGINSGVLNNRGSGSNQRPQYGAESPLESLAALSVMSPTLPIPPTTRSGPGHPSGPHTSSPTPLQTPTSSSSPLTTIPSTIQSQTLSSLYQGSNLPLGLNGESNEGNHGQYAVSQNSSASDMLSSSGVSQIFQGQTSRSNQHQQFTPGSLIQALPPRSTFNHYSLSSQYGSYQQQPTPGQSPQSKQLHVGTFSKSHESTTTNNSDSNNNNNGDNVSNQNDGSRSTSDSMSTSESERGRSRSRSVAGPLIIPTRNIPPRAPQTTAPRKYHGRQSRKPLLDHLMPHHHLQQYQGFVTPHYHPSSSPYQHYPTREPVPPTRRIAHILSEQKRREKINVGFDELKSVIPECAENTDSKATILRKAVDYILLLEDELRKCMDQYQQESSHDPDDDHGHVRTK